MRGPRTKSRVCAHLRSGWRGCRIAARRRALSDMTISKSSPSIRQARTYRVPSTGRSRNSRSCRIGFRAGSVANALPDAMIVSTRSTAAKGLCRSMRSRISPRSARASLSGTRARLPMPSYRALSRVLPLPRIKLRVSGRFSRARQAKQRAECTERIEPAIEAEGELVEVRLQVLEANAVVCAFKPRPQIEKN